MGDQRNDSGEKVKNVKSECKMCGTPLASSSDPKKNPFCSERCRLQDLSKWFGENYRIASHQTPATKDETEE